MKRLFYLCLVFICSNLICIDVIAQTENQKVKFMEHLSVGIEAGLPTGFGFEVATTLHPHFALRAGIVMFPRTLNDNAWLNFYGDDSYDDIVEDNPQIKADLIARGLPTKSRAFHEEVRMKGKFKMYNGKVLIDYYPRVKRSFHVTFGFYFSGKNLIVMKGQVPVEYMEAIRTVNAYLPQYDQIMPAVEKGDFLVDYFVEASPSGKIQYSWQTNPIKPYIGIGGGRAVPNKRFGCHFDIGLMIQGKLKMSSKYYTRNMLENFGMEGFLSVIPLASIRLEGRIF